MQKNNEMDYCDLDPTKICDNCCKCIDSGNEYEDFNIELTDKISTMDELIDMPLDMFDDEDDEYTFDPMNVAPIDIDPALMAEWEHKLRVAEIEDAQRRVAGLHGMRKKK